MDCLNPTSVVIKWNQDVSGLLDDAAESSKEDTDYEKASADTQCFKKEKICRKGVGSCIKLARTLN